MKKPTVTYPGVFIEERHTSVKVIPGVSTSVASATHMNPSALIASGYKIVATQIETGGMSLLLGKGAEHVLVRMAEYREGGSVDGHLVVTFAAKVP
jgi:hypothetical protein